MSVMGLGVGSFMSHCFTFTNSPFSPDYCHKNGDVQGEQKMVKAMDEIQSRLSQIKDSRAQNSLTQPEPQRMTNNEPQQQQDQQQHHDK